MARRMRRLRLVMGYNVAAKFATEFLEMSPQRWNNFERGVQPISNTVADMLIRKIPGLTSDWLRYGNPNGLSVQMHRQLDEGALLEPPPNRRGHPDRSDDC
jgi:hypothetical protein